MTQQDYVTRDVAEILLQKGFNERCRGYFYYNLFCISYFGNEYNKQGGDDNLIDAPSLAQAAKWLRTKEIEVSSNLGRDSNKWFFFVQRFATLDADVECLSENKYNTYEESLNEGIKEALKML